MATNKPQPVMELRVALTTRGASTTLAKVQETFVALNGLLNRSRIPWACAQLMVTIPDGGSRKPNVHTWFEPASATASAIGWFV